MFLFYSDTPKSGVSTPANGADVTGDFLCPFFVFSRTNVYLKRAAKKSTETVKE